MHNKTVLSLPNGLFFPVGLFLNNEEGKLGTWPLDINTFSTSYLIGPSTMQESPAMIALLLQSEILGEWEALSRRVKVIWAVNNGHDVLSLVSTAFQHDGIVLALRKKNSNVRVKRSVEARISITKRHIISHPGLEKINGDR